MIYDCFSFFNELDILEIRLNTLAPIVDRFVLVESVWTHTGKPKPLYFADNKNRFKPFLDKIIHIVVNDNDLPPIPSGVTEREIAWIRENVQRNAIVKGLTDAKPDDILMISDLDEIPNPEKVLEVSKSPKGITNINLKNYAFFLNNLNVAAPIWTGGPQLLTYRTFLDHKTYARFAYSEYAPRCANPIPSATVIRFARKDRTIRNAGWHYSSMGGIKSLKTKLQAFAHTEFAAGLPSDEDLEKRLRNGQGLFNFGDFFMAEPLEIALPPFIRNNQKRFSKMILPASSEHWSKCRFKRFYLRLHKTLHDRAIGIIIAVTPRFARPFFARIRHSLGI